MVETHLALLHWATLRQWMTLGIWEKYCTPIPLDNTTREYLISKDLPKVKEVIKLDRMFMISKNEN